MIAFATLFLGLVTGVVPLSLLVEGPVAEVRLQMDGKQVGTVQGPPWTLTVDFGRELMPRELVARAVDGQGKEIATARQMVNLPRPPAGVDVVLERDKKGNPVAATYSGASLVAQEPARVNVTFDNKTVSSSQVGRVELPPYNPEEPHVLSVELVFTPAVHARADVVFGGGTTSVATSELTAVPIRVREATDAPSSGDLSEAFSRAGEPLSVTAIENGSVLLCIVRGPTVAMALSVLGTGGKTTLRKEVNTKNPLPAYDRDASREMMTLDKGDRLRFLWPVTSVKNAAPGTQLFDHSRDFDLSDAGIHWLLTRVEHPGPYPGLSRLADATAVAGLEAAASSSRRAVVLVLGDEVLDPSRYTPSAVRQYLSMIRVPLFVWSLKGISMQALAKEWGHVEDISSMKGLTRAVDRLKADLARQRIVWVQGRHLPQEIELAEGAKVELAR
jgi:hypothetical protein